MINSELCVSVDGAVYCWDETSRSIKKVLLQDVNITECPESVITAIVSKFAEKARRNALSSEENRLC
jgi:hypothetical protein